MVVINPIPVDTALQIIYFQWFLNGTFQSGAANTFEALVAGNYSVIAISISAVGTVAFDANASIIVNALDPIRTMNMHWIMALCNLQMFSQM